MQVRSSLGRPAGKTGFADRKRIHPMQPRLQHRMLQKLGSQFTERIKISTNVITLRDFMVRQEGEESPLNSAFSLKRSRRPNTPTGYWRNNLPICSTKLSVLKALRVKFSCSCWNHVSTMSYTAWVLPIL